MKERGILFDAEMVRAYLAGRKSQTRRLLRKQPLEILPMPSVRNPPEHTGKWVALMSRDPNRGIVFRCKYGVPGDHLYVKETFTLESWTYEFGDEPPLPTDRPWKHLDNGPDWGNEWLWPHYRATDPKPELAYEDSEKTCVWTPSIFMPRWASRITFEILDIRVERLQDITEADARAEGWDGSPCPEIHADDYDPKIAGSALEWYRNLWRRLNGKKAPWKSNPWVWVITFPPNKP